MIGVFGIPNTMPLSRKIIFAIGAFAIAGVILGWMYLPSMILYALIGGPLAVFLVIGFSSYKRNDTPRNFFLYQRSMPSGEFVPTFVSTNIGLFSSIIFSAILAFSYGVSGMIATTLAWFAGMYWFSRQVPILLPFFRRGNTIHEYIAETYGTDAQQKRKLRSFTSLVTMLLYWASIAVEVKVGSDLLAPALGGIDPLAIALVLALIGLTYTYFSGYRGVVITDAIQYRLMAGAALICFFVSTYMLLTAPAVTFPVDYFSFPTIVLSPDPYGLFFSLCPLLLLYQFCVMDMWQRCIALSQTKTANGDAYSEEQIVDLLKRKTFRDAVVPFLLFFVAWFSVGVAAVGLGLTNNPNLAVSAFVSAIDEFGRFGVLLRGLLLAGFVAAILSTIDTFLVAMTQTFMYDIYGTFVVPDLASRIDKLNDEDSYRFVHLSRFWIIVFGATAILLGFWQFDLISFWTTMYAIMLSFFAPIYISLRDDVRRYTFDVVLVAVIGGSIGALVLGVLGTFVFKNSWLTNSAALFAILFSYVIMKVWRKP